MQNADPACTVTALTPLLAAHALGERIGAGLLWLKLECRHPTGVHKHRSAAAIVAEARRRGLAGIALGTCGNAGLALAPAAAAAGLELLCCVPARYASDAVVRAMQAAGAQVSRTPGSYEDAVEAAARLGRERDLFDANPAGACGAVSLAAYARIAREIEDQCASVLDSVWVPVGNGTTYAGIGQGFLDLAHAPGVPGTRMRPPRVCAAGSAGNTAAVRSIQAGRVVELDPASLCETSANEPLLNWRSAHAAEALAVARATGGLAEELTDAELLQAAGALAYEGVRAHPSGAAGVAGLTRALAAGTLAPGRHVAVITASSRL